HPFELPAEALARPALAADRLDAGRDLSDHRRGAVVDEARSGFRRTDAILDRPDNLDDSLTVRDQGMHDVAGTDLRRRLGRAAADADIPAIAHLPSHGAPPGE